MKKFWIIALILILVGVGYFAWRTQNESMRRNAPMCGGIAGLICPEGYACKGMGDYPDAAGYCVKE